jgi:hypothetical protein
MRAETRAHLDEVLGVREALESLSPAAVGPLLGEIRVTLLHGIKRLARGGHDQSWTHCDTEILQSAGEVSAGFPMLLQRLAPRLDGLAKRLASDGATFLDFGVGAALLSIEVVRLWPTRGW